MLSLNEIACEGILDRKDGYSEFGVYFNKEERLVTKESYRELSSCQFLSVFMIRWVTYVIKRCRFFSLILLGTLQHLTQAITMVKI